MALPDELWDLRHEYWEDPNHKHERMILLGLDAFRMSAGADTKFPPRQVITWMKIMAEEVKQMTKEERADVKITD